MSQLYRAQLDEQRETLFDLTQRREAAIDEGDMETVAELDGAIEAAEQDITRLEMLIERSA